jgi:WD40 repeat protein
MWKLGSPVILGRHDAGVTAVRIGPGGAPIFTSSLDRTVKIWGGGETLIQFKSVRRYSRLLPTLATTLAVNEKFLVCAMHNDTVQLHSPKTGRLLRKLPNPQERSAYAYNFHTVTTHPTDPGIIAGSNGGYVVIWSAAGEILWRETSFRLVNTVCFLRNGKLLMAHEWDPWLHVWDFETKQRLKLNTSLMDTSANWVTACVAPTGSKFDFVLSTEGADESMLVGVNLDSPEPLWQRSANARVHDLRFLPDGRHLLSGGDSGVLELWDTGNHDAPQRLDLRADPALAGEFDEDGGRKTGMILTIPTLDDEFHAPWTIHSLDVGHEGTFAVLGMANGMVLRVALDQSPA